MKAANRVRAYIQALKKCKDADSPYYRMDGASLHVQDLEEVLLSRKEYRRRARAEHKAAQSLLADNAALRIENAALQEQLRKERAAVQSAWSSLRLREEQREDTARTAERDSILNVLYGPLPDRKSLYTNSEILQSIRALQRAAQTEEISQEFHDYRQDADTFLKNLCRALHLPLTSSAAQILQEVQRLRQDAEKLRDDEHRKLREALQLRDASFEGMISNVRELRTGNTAELRRAQDAEKQYRTLRQALREVCAAVLPAYKDKDAGQQLAALQLNLQTAQDAARIAETKLHAAEQQQSNEVDLSGSDSPDAVTDLQDGLNRSRSIDQRIILNRAQAWQLLHRATRKPEFPSKGVQAISEARAYQLSRYPAAHDAQPGHARQLLAAAIALVSGVSALYPFGEDSWEKIRHYGPRGNGRRNQYAHAGACIAALIDLLPAQGVAPLNRDGAVPWDVQARRIAREKDRAAYPGEAGDLF